MSRSDKAGDMSSLIARSDLTPEQWRSIADRQPYAEYMTERQRLQSLHKDVLTRVAKAVLAIPDADLRQWGW